MKACVVRHADTGELYRFTLGEKGDIIIIDSEEYDIDKLEVSLVPKEEVVLLHNDYYVMMMVGDHGE
jgi:hypothetical protein